MTLEQPERYDVEILTRGHFSQSCDPAVTNFPPSAFGGSTPAARFPCRFRLLARVVCASLRATQRASLVKRAYDMCTTVGLQRLLLLFSFKFEAAGASSRVQSSKSPPRTFKGSARGRSQQLTEAVGVDAEMTPSTFRVVHVSFCERL